MTLFQKEKQQSLLFTSRAVGNATETMTAVTTLMKLSVQVLLPLLLHVLTINSLAQMASAFLVVLNATMTTIVETTLMKLTAL